MGSPGQVTKLSDTTFEKGEATPPFLFLLPSFISVICIAALLVILASFCFLPPFERDELVYHLAIPSFWLRNGLADMPFSHYSYYPWTPFFINYVSIACSSPTLAHAIHLLAGAGTGFLIYRAIPSRSVALAVTALFLSLQPVIRVMPTAYSDCYVLLLGTAAYLLLERWSERGDRTALILSAIACGIGLCMKHTMLVYAFLLCLQCLRYACRAGSSGRIIRDVTLYLSVAGLIYLPFLVKNAMLTGNPTYPFFSSLFPGSNAFSFENVSHFLYRKVMFDENLVQILSGPFMLFFHGQENSQQYFDGVLNPFLLIIPLAALSIRRTDATVTPALFAFAYIAFILFLEPVSARFVLPIVPLLAISSGRFLSGLRRTDAAATVACLFLLFNIAASWRHIADADKFRYLSGRMTADAFIGVKSPDYPVVTAMNAMLPPGSRILLQFTGHRTFYLAHDFIYDSHNDGRLWQAFAGTASKGAEIARSLSDAGITHVFLHRGLFLRYIDDNASDQERAAVDDFFDRTGSPILAKDELLVFDVRKAL